MTNEYISEELQKLRTLAEQLRMSIASAPVGRLRSEMCKGRYPQFYYLQEDGSNKCSARKGRYLGKKERYLAEALAQKEYDSKLLQCIEKQCKLLEAAKQIDPEMLRKERFEIVQNIAPAKRGMVNSYDMSDEEYTEQWLEQHSGGKNSIAIVNGFDTERGDIVRSKSEKMIADKLFYNKIAYQYEPLLEMKDGSKVIPDFVMLNVKTRATVYLEHFGMMDNPEYCRKAIEKMEMYERNGLQAFKDVIYTFESSTKAINMKFVEDIINRLVG